MDRSTVRTSSQDVDGILSQEGGPIHISAEGENRFARLGTHPEGQKAQSLWQFALD